MKRIACFFLLLASCAPAFAWNEPDSFRGIKWGTDIAALGTGWVETERDGSNAAYKRIGDQLNIGTAAIGPPAYVFYKGRFYAAIVTFRSLSNFQKIKDTVFSAYGPGVQYNRYIERFLWSGTTVTVLLTFDSLKMGSLYYQYGPIAKQREADSKEAGQMAVGDL